MHIKYRILSLIALGTVLSSTAQSAEHTPYVGADYSYVNLSAKQADPSYHAAVFNIGDRYNDYFGTELFFEQTGSDAHKTPLGKYKTSYRAYGLDMAVYLPLGCEHRFEPFISGGIGEYVMRQKLLPNKHKNDSGYGYRFGAGLIYNLNENIALRASARYVKTDHISNVDHLSEYTMGLRYYFNKGE